MSKPDVPLRLEFAVEVPGTPEQVWDAIATARGISSWFLPTDLEEREGGTIVTHMGEDVSSPGTVTGWDPPDRLVYSEPEWASLAGQDDDSVTPLVTEFVVEARSGGTCVVRVVSSAFGSGADWEREFFDDMERGWLPFFDRLKLYLEHYTGQRAAVLSAERKLSGEVDEVWSAMLGAIGPSEVGQPFDVRGHSGRVEQRLDERGHSHLFVHLTEPVPGFLSFGAFGAGEGSTQTMVHGQLFSEDADELVEREQPAWVAWLESLDVEAATSRTS